MHTKKLKDRNLYLFLTILSTWENELNIGIYTHTHIFIQTIEQSKHNFILLISFKRGYYWWVWMKSRYQYSLTQLMTDRMSNRCKNFKSRTFPILGGLWPKLVGKSPFFLYARGVFVWFQNPLFWSRLLSHGRMYILMKSSYIFARYMVGFAICWAVLDVLQQTIDEIFRSKV